MVTHRRKKFNTNFNIHIIGSMVSSAKHAHFTSFGKTKILYRVYIFPHMQQLQFSSQCIHWIFIREQIGYRKTICITFIAFLVYETLSLKRNFHSTEKSISKFIDIVLNFLFTLNPLIQIRHIPPPAMVSLDTIVENIPSFVKKFPSLYTTDRLNFRTAVPKKTRMKSARKAVC